MIQTQEPSNYTCKTTKLGLLLISLAIGNGLVLVCRINWKIYRWLLKILWIYLLLENNTTMNINVTIFVEIPYATYFQELAWIACLMSSDSRKWFASKYQTQERFWLRVLIYHPHLLVFSILWLAEFFVVLGMGMKASDKLVKTM